MAKKALTDKQEKFVMAVIEGKSKSDAYRTHYNASKMTDKTVHEAACKLMSDSKVSARYEELLAKVRNMAEKKMLLTAEDVINSILDIRNVCAARYEVTNKVGDVVGENIIDAQAALKANELLGKHLKLFTDKVEHSGEISMPTIVIGK